MDGVSWTAHFIAARTTGMLWGSTGRGVTKRDLSLSGRVFGALLLPDLEELGAGGLDELVQLVRGILSRGSKNHFRTPAPRPAEHAKQNAFETKRASFPITSLVPTFRETVGTFVGGTQPRFMF